jgi:multidrug efflux system membrane fusion protein
VACVALTAVGCHSPPSRAPTPITVKVATLSPTASQPALRYSAQIEPFTKVDLAFRVGGYVESIAAVPGVDGKPRLIQSGDRVRSGQELAHIRMSDYAQKVAQAKASFAQARAGVDQAKLDFGRTKTLAASGSVSQAELDSATTKLDAAKASADAAQAQVAEAETSLADTRLRSPLDGLVLTRNLEVGALVSPGTVAFTVADTENVKVVFGVPDTLLTRMRLGSAQEVTTEAFKDAVFQGRITRISPVADPKSRSFEVEIAIPNADQRLKSGMVAALGIASKEGRRTDTPLAPLSAIVRSGAKHDKFGVFVVVDEGGRSVAHLREVELGDFAGSIVPVEHGLAGNERVVVMGAGLLSDGDLVGVVD